MYVMISYDIVDDKTRNKVMKLLKDYGTKVQYSVFECDISEEQFKEIKQKIEELINKEEDKVRYYPICKACLKRVVISGWGEIREDEGFEVI